MDNDISMTRRYERGRQFRSLSGGLHEIEGQFRGWVWVFDKTFLRSDRMLKIVYCSSS
jgi:hypothetical protein